MLSVFISSSVFLAEEKTTCKICRHWIFIWPLKLCDRDNIQVSSANARNKQETSTSTSSGFCVREISPMVEWILQRYAHKHAYLLWHGRSILIAEQQWWTGPPGHREKSRWARPPGLVTFRPPRPLLHNNKPTYLRKACSWKYTLSPVRN